MPALVHDAPHAHRCGPVPHESVRVPEGCEPITGDQRVRCAEPCGHDALDRIEPHEAAILVALAVQACGRAWDRAPVGQFDRHILPGLLEAVARGEDPSLPCIDDRPAAGSAPTESGHPDRDLRGAGDPRQLAEPPFEGAEVVERIGIPKVPVAGDDRGGTWRAPCRCGD